METVLIVAAHPDDEVLGVGGTIARHAANGDQVEIVIMAQGATSRSGAGGAAAMANELESLRACARAAAVDLGAAAPRFLEMPDNRMDSLDILDVVKAVEKVVAETRPTIVYTHFAYDLNIDHRITHQAVVTACRPMQACPVKVLRAFESLSSTEWNSQVAFEPNFYVNIAPWMGAKLRALGRYAAELRPFPHPRSPDAVKALSQMRGSVVGFEAAEAFRTIWHRE